MAVAQRAQGFNMKILGFDPFAAPVDAEKLGIEVADNLERIFKESDYITIHVPKNENTLNMIGAEQIKMMKPDVRLINCARGGIINEDALYEALAKNVLPAPHLTFSPSNHHRTNVLPSSIIVL